MFKVVRYNKVYKAAWNTFVKSANTATFLFDRSFMDYHKDLFSDHSLLIFKENNLLALFPANETDGEIYSHQGLSYGGLIMSLYIKSEDVYSCFYWLLKYYHDHGFQKVIYKSLPHYYISSLSTEDSYALHLAKAKLVHQEASSVIDLNLKIPWQKRRIRSLSKSKAAGMSFLLDSNKWKGFWEILENNLNKRHETRPVHSLKEIKKLKKRFHSNIKLCVALKDELVMAGIVLFVNKKTLHAQYISASEEGKKIGALDGLIQTITELCKGYHYLSLGVSYDREKKKINKGLLQWKEGFGARPFSHNIYEILTSNFINLLEY